MENFPGSLLTMKNKFSSFVKIKKAGLPCTLVTAVAIVPSAHADPATTNSTTAATATTAAATPSTAPALSPAWKKPAWLTDLSASARQSYDDNVLLVSGLGLPKQDSWISSASAKVGFDFAPLLNDQNLFKSLTFVYSPDVNIYYDAPQENNSGQRIGDSIKASDGDFSLTVDNGFLYNIGSHEAPIYALSQAPGGNTDDRFRNFYAQAVPRERRDQIQDRGAFSLQYDVNSSIFIRAVATTLYYNLHTTLRETVAPYIGYQNWPDRYDANGGADGGYRLTKNFAVTVGYRYGHQYQAQFPEDVSPADRHFSSNDYQRALLGLEGTPWSWLNVKVCAGPDFRYYNSMAPVNDRHAIYPFVEGAATATITQNQTLTFSTKDWEWVASTGLVPYYDMAYLLTYHWNATRHWGFDVNGKILNANFSSGNDTAGSEPSKRNDIQYTAGFGVTYTFTQNFNANLTYCHNIGRNLDELPPTLAPAYRNFAQDLVALGIQYKF